MRELIAYGTVAGTVTLTVFQPRITRSWRVGPGTATALAALILMAAGIVSTDDLLDSARLHWRPFIMIASIMITASIVQQMGIATTLSEQLFGTPGLSLRKLFIRVFVFSAAVSSVLNNDAMILLVTPLVITFIRNRYPGRPDLAVPFAFAVFLSVGVAPFVVANPMNMIVATYAHLNFNQYAQWMLPVTLSGWVIVLPLALYFFRKDLPEDVQATEIQTTTTPARLNGNQKIMIGLLFAMLAAYPLVAYHDGPSIWLVALCGAALSLVIAARFEFGIRRAVTGSIDWNILVFLLCVYVIAIGLRNVGAIEHIAQVYSTLNLGLIASVSGLGSAILNNHPMAIINLLALETVPDAGRPELLAAMVGGDIGPRLLPMGSLAGLLWIESCRRQGIEISVRTFFLVGLLVTIPSVAAAVLILSLRLN